jgi:hypothetical protein
MPVLDCNLRVKEISLALDSEAESFDKNLWSFHEKPGKNLARELSDS